MIFEANFTAEDAESTEREF